MNLILTGFHIRCQSEATYYNATASRVVMIDCMYNLATYTAAYIYLHMILCLSKCIVRVFLITVINPCASTPCANNSSCTSTSPFDYTCQCLPGYTGSKCEAKIIQDMSLASPGSSSGTTTTIALLGTLCVLAFLVSAILLVCLVILRRKIFSNLLSSESN